MGCICDIRLVALELSETFEVSMGKEPRRHRHCDSGRVVGARGCGGVSIRADLQRPG